MTNQTHNRICYECRVGSSEPNCRFATTQVYRCTHCPAMTFSFNFGAMDFEEGETDPTRQFLHDVRHSVGWLEPLHRFGSVQVYRHSHGERRIIKLHHPMLDDTREMLVQYLKDLELALKRHKAFTYSITRLERAA